MMDSFFKELKRRNVFRVGVAYIVVSWVALQFVDVIQDPLALPEWFQKVVIVLLAIGFPIALIISWAFEMTPQGLVKTAEVDKDNSITPKTGRKIDKLIIGGLSLAVVFLLIDRFVIVDEHPMRAPAKAEAQAQPAQASIAVLPFEDLSQKGDQEYFADGISEEILNVLAAVKDLRVTSRSSSFSLKGQHLDVPTMGKRLGVGYILEGSVRKQGERVRITAQLIDVKTDSHLWSNTYDRQSADIFDVQEDIAKAIASALQVQFGTAGKTAEVKAPTENLQAHEEYLKGRYYWNLRGIDNIYTAKQHFEKALALDPKYALAHLALAETLVLIPDYAVQQVDQRETYVAAETNAKKALELDPDLGQAHTTLGFIYAELDQWGEADAEYKKALAVTPDYATAWQWYANVGSFTGRLGQSERLLVKARELDPMSRIILSNYIDALIQVGKYDQAKREIDSGLALFPDFGLYYNSLVQLDYVKQDFAAMRADWQKSNRLSGYDTETGPRWFDLIEAYRKTGKPAPVPADMQQSARKLEIYSSPPDFVYLSGHHDLAFEEIRGLLSLTGPRYALFYSIWFPTYKPIRQDPEFKKVMREAGFVDLWNTYGWPDLCKRTGGDDFECE